MNGLEELDISCNALGQGIIELTNHLHRVPSLTKLNLAGTEMVEKEATAVGRRLPRITRLEELHLSINPLGCGIMELAKHLNFVPGLRILWLSNTQMHEKEVSALARALKHVPKLVSLNLSGNPLGRGVSVLIQHLSSVPKLRALFLFGVKMTKSEAEELCTACKDISLCTEYHVSVLFLLKLI